MRAADLARFLEELVAVGIAQQALERRVERLHALADRLMRGRRATLPTACRVRRERARAIAAMLLEVGTPKHRIASIVAARLGCTPRTARRLLGTEQRRPPIDGSLWG